MENILNLAVIVLLFISLFVLSFFLKKESKIAYNLLVIIRCLVLIIELILVILNIIEGDIIIFNLTLAALQISGLLTLLDIRRKDKDLEVKEKIKLEKELDEIRKDFIKKETSKNDQQIHLDIG